MNNKTIAIICALPLIVLIVIGVVFVMRPKEDSTMDSKNYISSVKANDFKTAHEILDALYKNYLDAIANCDGGGESKDSLNNTANQYWDAAMYIYKAEIMYLLPMNDAAANQRLVMTIESINIPARKPHADIEYNLDNEPRLHAEFDAYMYFVERYNRLCDEILDISIMHNNEEMADKIIMLFEDEYFKKGAGHHCYTFTKNTSPLDNAKQRLKEAYDEGKFN